jgi:hypothetical protein
MIMPDFYFAYEYDSKHNTANKLCRHMNGTFERYDKTNKKWVIDNELSRIFIGEDVYYDEITEVEADKIIKQLKNQ